MVYHFEAQKFLHVCIPQRARGEGGERERRERRERGGREEGEYKVKERGTERRRKGKGRRCRGRILAIRWSIRSSEEKWRESKNIFLSSLVLRLSCYLLYRPDIWTLLSLVSRAEGPSECSKSSRRDGRVLAMHTTATTRTSEITGRQQQPLLLSPLCYRQKKRGYQSIIIFEKQIYIAVQAIRLAVKMTKGAKRPHGQDYFYSTGAV